MQPIRIKNILNDRELSMNSYDSRTELSLITTGAYGWCRHPMQIAVIILIVFASPYFTVDRIIFIAVHVIGIVVGVALEEKRNVSHFKNFVDYQKQVPYMFVKGVFWSHRLLNHFSGKNSSLSEKNQ